MRSDRIVLAQAASRHDDEATPSEPWLVLEDRALPLSRWSRAASIDALIAKWPSRMAELQALTSSPEVASRLLAEGIELAALDIEAPVRPRQVFCTIGNYHRQVIQAAVDAGDGPEGAGAGRRRADAEAAIRDRREPYICLSSPGRVAAPAGVLPITESTLDWEVEIAAVLAPGAPDLVAGYCTANDLTVRAKVARADLPALGSDWVQSKGQPGSLPLGPWFVPAWQVPDLDALRLRLWVNGRLMQDELAGDMIFGVAEQIAYLSRHVRLDPGDVVCTGSPAGFGAHYGRYLRPGDVMVTEVSGLGAQRVRCVGAVPVAAQASCGTEQTT